MSFEWLYFFASEDVKFWFKFFFLFGTLICANGTGIFYLRILINVHLNNWIKVGMLVESNLIFRTLEYKWRYALRLRVCINRSMIFQESCFFFVFFLFIVLVKFVNLRWASQLLLWDKKFLNRENKEDLTNFSVFCLFSLSALFTIFLPYFYLSPPNKYWWISCGGVCVLVRIYIWMIRVYRYIYIYIYIDI